MNTVSIIIPCHNAARWLAAAIDSALACDGAKEVIVVDDGSTDHSGEIARGFGDRIVFIRQPQRGGNVARNAGLRAARGEWLQFLDADDYLEPNKLSRQFAEAGDVGAVDVLYSPTWMETWRDGRVAERTASPLDRDVDLFIQWIRWELPQTGGPLWRAEALRRTGGWNEAMPCCQEHELYLRALQAGLRWKFCPSPGAVYRIWSETTVCRKDPVAVIRTRTALIDRLLAWLAEAGRLSSSHSAAAGQACFEMSRTWAQHDLASAHGYFNERLQHGLIRPQGPAAPLFYRTACRVLGFRRAESLARRLR